jgi:hypothetical protein
MLIAVLRTLGIAGYDLCRQIQSFQQERFLTKTVKYSFQTQNSYLEPKFPQVIANVILDLFVQHSLLLQQNGVSAKGNLAGHLRF